MIPYILLIEDNPGDSALVTNAIKEIRGDVGIVIAPDGESGMTMLQSMQERGTPPDLIISNFHLPRMSGAQVLAAVERDKKFKSIPLIMLTSSTQEVDRTACAGAKAYLIKGATWEDTRSIAKQIVDLLPATKGNKLEPTV